MLKYASFILIDIYTQDCAVSVEEVANSPANENHMVAYVFGIYTENFLTKVISSWNFVGGTNENNTYNSLENTYIGSYWQAEVIDDTDVVNENMQNMLDYIFYLLGETDVNPTKEGRTPLLASSSWGIYHPDYGFLELHQLRKR
jgi:cobaltochelatase CobN